MAKDPFVELMSSLFGTFSTPPRRPDDAPGGSAAGGEANTLASKGDRLREKEAARRVRQLREQIASRLERPLADLQLIDSQIGAAGQHELERAERSMAGWAKPDQKSRRPRPHNPDRPDMPAMDAFSLDRVRLGIANTLSSARGSLAGDVRRLLSLGEDRLHEQHSWFGSALATLAIELGRMRAGHHIPPEQEWRALQDQLKQKAGADLKQWREHVAAAERARLRQFETFEAVLLARATERYDLAAQADPAKIVSLASVRIKQASPGIALFRPFPPTPSGFQRRSHFGGLPDLPAGCEWPRHELLGPLHFLAQIDFAELTHNIPDLPQEGTLLFFASLSNAKIESPPIIIFDPDSTGRQAEMPGFRHSLGGSQGLLRLPGDAMHAEFLLPYWPIGTGLVETLPAPATLDANACLKPEYAGYCRAHDSFRQGQFAIAAAPLKVDSRQWGHEQRSWRKELFAAHVTLHPWTWRGLLYVAEGIAGSFAHPEISQSAARWMAESRKHDLDSPIPSAVGEQFARLVDTAREEEERLYMRNEKAGRWDALGGSNARAIERLLLDAAAQPAIAASLPRELLATLAESHVASPSGQIFGHLSSVYPVPDPNGDEVCLLQLFHHPMLPVGADELRFVLPRQALCERAWDQVRLRIPWREAQGIG